MEKQKKKQKRTKVSYEKDFFEELLDQYKEKLDRIISVEKEFVLSTKILDEKKSLLAKIEIVNKCINFIEKSGFLNFTTIYDHYKNRSDFKIFWAKKVFLDYNEIFKKKLH